MLNAAPSPHMDRVTPRRSASPVGDDVGGIGVGSAVKGVMVEGAYRRPSPTLARPSSGKVRVCVCVCVCVCEKDPWCPPPAGTTHTQF